MRIILRPVTSVALDTEWRVTIIALTYTTILTGL